MWYMLPLSMILKNKLDAYWSTQEMMYNYRTEISGTGNRSVTM